MLIDAELDARMPTAQTAPAECHEAMRYAVFPGGGPLLASTDTTGAASCPGR